MSTFLVTGANRGIGLEFCRQLVERGDEVIATARQPAPELVALGVRVLAGIDVASEESVAELARELEGVSLDVLINNAGILTSDSLETLDLEAIRDQFEVNALGPLRVTRALRENLRDGGRVAILTSLMGSLSDNGSGGYYGYRMSKAAVNVVGVNLGHDLREREISVVLLHPGMVATEMTGGRGISPSQSVSGLLERLDTLGIEQSGTFWHTDGRQLPW